MKTILKPTKLLGWGICLVLLTAMIPSNILASGRPEYVPDELIIQFRPELNKNNVDSILQKINGKIRKRFRLIPSLLLKVPPENLQAALKHLKDLPEVEYVEPNYLRYLDTTPNDPKFTDMWGLNNTGQTGGTYDADIDGPEAWEITTGTSDMVVAVIDSGADLNHEDLAGNIWTNPGEIPENGVDDDGNGYIDDIHGWDFAWNDNNPSDTDAICGGHGTHTAGTIGAQGDNGVGVTGVNWDVKIMPLKIFRKYLLIYCSTTSADIIEAVEYASMMGVRVSNNSYGGGAFSQAEYDAIRASKSIFVAAAGNETMNNDATPSYPATYNLDNIISVAATDHNDILTSFSNYGTSTVDLGAPGENILSTTPADTYSFFNGTSMASPHVAGAIALLMGNAPTLTNREVKWNILNSIDYVGLPVQTGGRLNIFNAMTLPPPQVNITITPDGPTTVSPGSSIAFTVTLQNTELTANLVNASLVVVLPDGREKTTLNSSFNIPGNGLLSQNFVQSIPAILPPGKYNLSGRVEVPSLSFDEDIVEYSVIP